MKASAPSSSRPGESRLSTARVDDQDPPEAHRVRQAGGRRELNAAADGPAAVQLIGCALKGVSPATWMSVQSTWNRVALTVTRSSRHERRRPTS